MEKAECLQTLDNERESHGLGERTEGKREDRKDERRAHPHIYTHTHIYTHPHAHTQVHTRRYACTHTHMYICTHARTHMHTYGNRTYTHTHAYTHIYTYTCIVPLYKQQQSALHPSRSPSRRLLTTHQRGIPLQPEASRAQRTQASFRR